ncbi:MAG TPA: thiamine pyrophosphate-dependent enzyme [Tepidisphaeraceae bacterium]|jgi:2-oxoisovalerate dehydrogenase E1 component|nr:thiamine pyrophosphate-dependent enzyme [Tepidisphaeraceae bacterium]
MQLSPPPIAAAVPVELHARAMLIRAVEKRLLDLFSQGKLFGTVHTCIGQEWIGVAVAEALEPGDLIFTNHRGHGHYLARTDDVDGLIAEVMGKQSGMCGGRGGSQHMCHGGVFSNGIQGGIVPVSAGLAMAHKLRGDDKIAVVYIGDGTLGEGALYETLNIASKWGLPLLVVLESNGYAQSTNQRQTLAGDICARAEAFGIETGHADTWNVPGLISAAAAAAKSVRKRRAPFFLQVDTYRLMAHSKGDDDRDKGEVGSFWDRDPITIFTKEDPVRQAEIESAIGLRVDDAVARADAAPYTTATPVDEAVPPLHVPHWSPTSIAQPDRMVSLIHAALGRGLARDPRIVLIGEDIEGPYGGAFKVTRDLSLQYPGRVRNTPISEAAIVGIGNGLALGGMVPVCEIMFGDFLTLCADQLINHASKFRYMYNDQVHVPLIVRTPMGGKRGYGPTHSQSLEKHFLGLPGTRMLALHHRFDPGLIYDRLLETVDRPTIVIENKLLYGQKVSDQAPAGFVLEHSDDAYPDTRLRPEGRADLTILCYGGMLMDVEKAVERLFDEHEIACEIICPTQLYPLNPWPVIESVRASGRLLIVEEGLSFAAFGAEVVAQVMESAPRLLGPVRRLASPRHPIPSSGPLEKALLPSASHVVEAALELIKHG